MELLAKLAKVLGEAMIASTAMSVDRRAFDSSRPFGTAILLQLMETFHRNLSAIADTRGGPRSVGLHIAIIGVLRRHVLGTKAICHLRGWKQARLADVGNEDRASWQAASGTP